MEDEKIVERYLLITSNNSNRNSFLCRFSHNTSTNKKTSKGSKKIVLSRRCKLIIIVVVIVATITLIIGLSLGLLMSNNILCGETVVISEKIKEINSKTFKDCKIVKSVIFSSKTKISIIGERTFEGSLIEEIVIPKTIITIGRYAFSNSKLKCITFSEEGEKLDGSRGGSSLLRIEDYAFDTTNLISITIPNTVEFIGDSAFKNCFDLTNVSFLNFQNNNANTKSNDGCRTTNHKVIDNNNSNLKTIGKCAFCNCTKLVAFTGNLPSLEIIGAEAFAKTHLSSLAWLATNSALKKIEDKAFYEVTTLTSANINAYSTPLEYIGQYAFYKSGLTTFVAPNLLKKIDQYAFYKAYDLTIFDTSNCKSLQEISCGAFQETRLASFACPISLKVIDDHAFSDVETLRTFGIKKCNSLEYIGSYSFSGTRLESFSCMPALKIIGDNAFAGVITLSTFDPSNCTNLKIIEFKAFFNTKIKYLIVPSSVITIGAKAFSSETKDHDLKYVEFPADTLISLLDSSAFENWIYNLCVLAGPPKDILIKSLLLRNFDVTEKCILRDGSLK